MGREANRAVRLAWLAPAALAGALIALLAALLWTAQTRTLEARQQELRDEADGAAEEVRLYLDGTRDYLLLLAKDMAGAGLDEATFQRLASK